MFNSNVFCLTGYEDEKRFLEVADSSVLLFETGGRAMSSSSSLRVPHPKQQNHQGLF